MKRIILCLALVIVGISGHAQTDNTFYAKGFPGTDVGSKIANAQKSCSDTVQCYIVIDPSLVSFPEGILPNRCATCNWIDYRSNSPFASSQTASSSGANQITLLGDSIIKGNQDNSFFTECLYLQNTLGQPCNNLGIGGQTSSQIAVRANAYAGQPHQTFASGFTIPTSGSVACTFQAGFEPAFNWQSFNGNYFSASQHANDPAYTAFPGVPILTTVSGVTYTLYALYNGSSYTCTPSPYPGSSVAVPSGNAWLTKNPPDIFNGFNIVWMGRNNTSNPTQVMTDIAATTAVLPFPKRYLLHTIPNAKGEGSGTSTYTAITSLNSQILAAYPSNSIDMRALINANYNPASAIDVQDHSEDVEPTSMRAGDFWTTLTAAISSTSTCAFTTASAAVAGTVMKIDSENILVTGGSNGAYTCTRGYFSGTSLGSTTPATHSSGALVAGVDFLHFGGNGLATPLAPYQNGYAFIAQQDANWMLANDFLFTLPYRSFLAGSGGLKTTDSTRTWCKYSGSFLSGQTYTVDESVCSGNYVQLNSPIVYSARNIQAGKDFTLLACQNSGTSFQITFDTNAFTGELPILNATGCTAVPFVGDATSVPTKLRKKAPEMPWSVVQDPMEFRSIAYFDGVVFGAGGVGNLNVGPALFVYGANAGAQQVTDPNFNTCSGWSGVPTLGSTGFTCTAGTGVTGNFTGVSAQLSTSVNVQAGGLYDATVQGTFTAMNSASLHLLVTCTGNTGDINLGSLNTSSSQALNPVSVSPSFFTGGSCGTPILRVVVGQNGGFNGTFTQISLTLRKPGPATADNLTLSTYTVSTLPACSAANSSMHLTVSDANSPTYLGTLTGGGSKFTPVVCNGTTWVPY